ncbi:MAG: ATP-binding protein [Spirochaetaceae bacterium]|jgi:predicted AAA+ superfamily ATPase|nr:ATP-binding protein [Spirochaetaceae bacterium]
MFSRELVKQIKARMREKRRFIQIVSGPRQTGKTTAITQALKGLAFPQSFVSADEPLSSREWLSNVWEQARLLQKQRGKDTILVIDEVQKIPQWSSVVKQLWDEDTRRKIPLKVILSGSSALLLQKGLAESLMGRFEILYSPHWSYAECRKAFGYSFGDFLFFGGYPGAAAFKTDEERWARYIGTSIVEPTISQDVLLMEEVRKPALLRSLFHLGAAYSAQELSYTKIMGQLLDAGNTVTLAHYLTLLDNANILCGLRNFSPKRLQVRQSSPRFMVYDTSLLTYASGTGRAALLANPEAKGHLAESAVGAYLLARGREEGFDVFYWRERDKEVDFVVQKGSKISALEVKSGRVRKTGGSLEFKKKYPQALGFVIGSQEFPLEDFLLGKIGLFG